MKSAVRQARPTSTGKGVLFLHSKIQKCPLTVVLGGGPVVERSAEALARKVIQTDNRVASIWRLWARRWLLKKWEG